MNELALISLLIRNMLLSIKIEEILNEAINRVLREKSYDFFHNLV